jgi:methyl-accepting chemotaxis protein
MKIKYKLLLGFLPIVFLIAVLSVITVRTVNSINQSINKLQNTNLQVNQATSDLRIDLGESIRAYEEYESGWIEKAELDSVNTFEQSEQQENFEILSNSNLISPEKIAHQKTLIDEYFALGDKLVDAHDKSHQEKVVLMADFDSKVEAIDQSLSDFSKENVNLSNVEMGLIQSRMKTFVVNEIILTIILILVSVLIVVLTVNSISASIDELDKAIRDVSEGKFKGKLTVKSEDEVGKLAETFNTMSENVLAAQSSLKETVKSRTNELGTMKDRTSELEAKIYQLEKLTRG